MATSGMSVVEQMRLRREKGRRLIHKIGVCQLAEGGVACILGVVSLVYAVPNGTFVYYIGTPLWTGIFLLISGLLGVLAGRERDAPGDVVTTKQKGLIVANYTMTITTMTPAIMIMVYSGIALSWCYNVAEGFENSCTIYHTENVAMSIVNIITGLILSITSIPFMMFYCFYARSFGLRVNNMSTAIDPVMEDQMRQQADIIRQQQDEIQRLAERQSHVEKQLASGSGPMDAPPPYDEPIPAVQVKTA